MIVAVGALEQLPGCPDGAGAGSHSKRRHGSSMRSAIDSPDACWGRIRTISIASMGTRTSPG